MVTARGAKGALWLTFAALAFVLLAGTARAASYTYTNLNLGNDPQGNGVVPLQALGVNDMGHVVGSANFVGANAQGFLYKDGVFHRLAGLPPQGSNNPNAVALDVNDGDSAVGDSNVGSSDPLVGTHGVLWKQGNSTATDLGTIFTCTHCDESHAVAINAAGTVVGYGKFFYSGSPPACCYRAAISHAGGGFVATGPSESSADWTAQGIGAGDLYALTRGGASSESSSLSDGTPLPFRPATTHAVSPGGKAVIGSKSGSAWEWTTTGGSFPLPPLPGDSISQANGVNDSGDAVGFSGRSGVLTAVIWHNAVPTDLNALVSGGPPWPLVAATAISNAGYIVGNGNGTQPGVPPVWLLSPGGHTLTIDVRDAQGNGVSGVTFEVTGAQAGQPVTGPDGIATLHLPPGDYTIAPPADGSIVPASSGNTDCSPIGNSCGVLLNADRTMHFVQRCVQPTPDGKPLPAATPDPIPGAQRFGQLEAVGCFTRQSDGTFTAEKPVRLDGIDVVADAQHKVILHPDQQRVRSSGPVDVRVAGQSFGAHVLDLNFGGLNIDAHDLGLFRATPQLGARLFGAPLALGAKFENSPGRSSLALSVSLPVDGVSKYDPLTGAFFDRLTQSNAASVGFSARLDMTNRFGFGFGQVCGGMSDLTPFFEGGPRIRGIKQCWTPKPGGGFFDDGTLGLSASFEVPPKTALGYPRVGIRADFHDYRLLLAAIEYDGVNKPIGTTGFFLQRLRGEARFHPDSAHVRPDAFTVGAGVSLGPKLSLPRVSGSNIGPYELLSGDVDGSLILTSPVEWRLAGSLTLLRGSVLEAPFANARISVFNSGLISLEGHALLRIPGIDQLPVIGANSPRFVGDLRGQEEALHSFDLEGHGELALGAHSVGASGVLNDHGVIVCTDGWRVGAAYAWGGDPTWFSQGTCDIGPWRRAPGASADTRASAAAASSRVLPSGLPVAYVRVLGGSSAPRVRLAGPGITATTPTPDVVRVEGRVLAVRDEAAHASYFAIRHPAAGTYRITTLPGSAPVLGIDSARLAPQSSVSASARSVGCRVEVRYRARPAPANSVELIAQDADRRVHLGRVSGAGRLRFDPSAGAGGMGSLLAVVRRGGLIHDTRTLTRYRLNNLGDPAAPALVRLSGPTAHRTLSWRAPCGVSFFRVLITRGRTITSRTVRGTHVSLGRVTRRTVIAVASISVDGRPGAQTRLIVH